jgi:flavin-dependent dehydrogenase
VLRELGLYAKFIAAGALEARHAMFHAAHRAYPTRPLPRPALCLSRFVMDDLLAREFRELGGVLRERERVAAANLGPGWVRATGRRAAGAKSGAKWIGLKVHARNVPLGAALEMHVVPDGYVGLCQLGSGVVNVCGLFAVRGPVPQLAARWPDFLRGPRASILRRRLDTAEFETASFRAVSGLNLRPASAARLAECCLGDALTLIPPLTGNGMSAAFESARWAADPLAAYSRGELGWEAARLVVARRCDAGLARRLRWAGWLQRMLLQPGSREFLLAVAGHSELIWRLCFARTR